jgi:hypothetical protein
MKMRWCAGLLLLVVAGASAPAKAQIGIYTVFTGQRLSGPEVGSGGVGTASGSFMAYGGQIGAYTILAHTGPVALGFDVRLGKGVSNNGTLYNNQLSDGDFGLRAEFKNGKAIRPYLQVGAGITNTNFGRFGPLSDGPGIAYQAGVDVRVAKHVDFRAEYAGAEAFNMGTPDGNSSTLMQNGFGVGVVARFGGPDAPLVISSKKTGGKKK